MSTARPARVSAESVIVMGSVGPDRDDADLALDEIAEDEGSGADADAPVLSGEGRAMASRSGGDGQIFLHAGWSELQPPSQKWKNFPTNMASRAHALFFTSGCAYLS